MWASGFAFTVLKNGRAKLVEAPLASFGVAPNEIVTKVKLEDDGLIQIKHSLWR